MTGVEATPNLEWVVKPGEALLDGRLKLNHSASSRAERVPSGEFVIQMTTRIEITATAIEHLHLIKYVLVSLALADLPGKKWTVLHDGGSLRMVFTRPNNALDIEGVQRLKAIIMDLAVPSLELSHAN